MSLKKYFIVSVLTTVMGIAIAVFISVPKKAHCAWCPTYRCYSRCSSQCACVTSSGEFGGSCISIQLVDRYLENGYIELK